LSLFSINHTDPGRIGFLYYQVGHYKTISKIAALEYAGGDISKVKFYCMDNDWDKIDITKEPQTSWDDLLKIRAWQLRDRYKYVALMYSGGWDSHTVLMTYIKNNIPLDEVIIWDRTNYQEDTEISDAYQTAKKLISDHNLKTKLTVYEVPWDHHAKIYKEAGEDYLYLPGCQLCFNQTARIVNHETLDNFLVIKNQHALGSAVFIEAHDKPRVNLWDGRWYHFYIDASMYQYIGKGASEMFYLTPHLPELQLKQAYMAIRYFEYKMSIIPNSNPGLVHEIQSFKHPNLYPEWNQHIGRVCQDNHSSIYGGIKHNPLTPKRTELYKLINHTKEYIDDIYNIYDSGLAKVKALLGPDAEEGEIPAIMSKQYYMRDFKSMEITS